MSVSDKDKVSAEDQILSGRVRAYLQGDGIRWGSRKGVEQTVEDVLRLDDDLKAFVRETLGGTAPSTPDIHCGNITLEELLKVFNPVAAAIWVQWYREEPVRALASLCMRGGIEGLPDPLANERTEAPKESFLGKLVVGSPIEKMVPTKNGPVPDSQFGSVGKKDSDRVYKHGIR